MGFWHSFDTVLARLHQKRALHLECSSEKWFKISEALNAGRLAQLVRAPALQAGGRRFESCTAHQCQSANF